jgi:hypothetical protein
MAEIVLSQAGAAAGASLLPNGLTVFGQAVSGAAERVLACQPCTDECEWAGK